MNPQFKAVLLHEWKYFLAIRKFKYSMVLFVLAPAIFLVGGYYYDGTINLYYPVFIMALTVPRITVNLIAYSIGGEKAYRTFESLLSTPVKLGAMFVGKSMISILFSVVLLVLSSLVTLGAANGIGYHFAQASFPVLFTPTQWILIASGLLICVLMIFLTGIAAMILKNPRKGLYLCSGLTFLSIVPPVLVAYCAQNTLFWSSVILLILFSADLILLVFVLKRIHRPQLMSKL